MKCLPGFQDATEWEGVGAGRSSTKLYKYRCSVFLCDGMVRSGTGFHERRMRSLLYDCPVTIRSSQPFVYITISPGSTNRQPKLAVHQGK